MKTLPASVPHGTDWLLLENCQVNQLAGSYLYLMSIWYLDLQDSRIESISDDFINTLQRNKTLRWLNLAKNRLSNIPRKIQELTFLQQVSLSGNPFDCHCSMTWMIDWLNNFTTTSGDHVIVDYKEVFCHSGLNVSDPIYKLDEVIMGCFPAKLTFGQKLGIGIGAALGFLVLILVFLVARNPREIKFYMYYYFKVDTVPKDDKNENVENMQYDAFFCYR